MNKPMRQLAVHMPVNQHMSIKKVQTVVVMLWVVKSPLMRQRLLAIPMQQYAKWILSYVLHSPQQNHPRKTDKQHNKHRQHVNKPKSNAQGTEQNGDQESSNPNIASESATSNPFQSLIDAAIEQSKSDNEDISITQNETINIARQSPLLSQAISGYTEASRLA
jgi:hypothetical protein